MACMERVADYVVDRLVENGIKHIFMITGRGILYLTDAVAKNRDIESVSTYHEQGASYAAMAYAAATDGMSACLVSTGCAAANAVTAALCAYQDNLPVVFISGQNMLNETTRHTGVPIRTYGSQEADIISVVQSVTKYAKMIEEPETVAQVMDEALHLANEGRKGPVWIDIPLDVQNGRIERDTLKRLIPDLDSQVLDFSQPILDGLKDAKRPLLFVGGGVRSANAIAELEQFITVTGVPVVFSASAVDAFGSDNELSIGAVGSIGGSRAGNFAVQNADFILVLGSKLCSQTTGEAKQFARNAKIIVVDIDKNEHKKKGVAISLEINQDVKVFLKNLLSHSLDIKCDEWREKCNHWKKRFSVKNEVFVRELKEDNKIDLYRFADCLSDCLGDEATVITDAGFEELIVPSTIRYKKKQRCLFPAAQGAMGYAIPAILGAYYAGKKDIVAVVGDGSIMMNIQEMLLISKYHIPAKIFVINNDMYAVIRKRQKDLFRTRTIGNDESDGVVTPDFKRLAEGFGVPYSSILGTDDLQKEITKVLNVSGPQLCEVHCVSEQNYLHTSFGYNEKRRLVRKSLEDLSPFLEHDIIREEMIVPMIEG